MPFTREKKTFCVYKEMQSNKTTCEKRFHEKCTNCNVNLGIVQKVKSSIYKGYLSVQDKRS